MSEYLTHINEYQYRMGPVIALGAPQPEPNYALGWTHFVPENDNWHLLDGIYWVAVKGEIDLHDIMPEREPCVVHIPTGPEGADELWTVLSAPQGMFWDESMMVLCKFKMLKAKVIGREICVKNVAINVNIMDAFIVPDEVFSELPPMLAPSVLAEDRVMTWSDCVAAAWNESINLELSLEGLDDGRTRTITMNDMVRVSLTPTLVAVLKSREADSINVGLITPNMQNMLEFVTA